MPRSTRRKLDVVLLCVGAVVFGVAAAVGAFVGRPEEVTSMWALAEVREPGSAQVTEVIDYDFGANTGSHGIFRVVPDLDPTAAIAVRSPDAPDQLLVTSDYDGTRLQIGDPGRTVSGRHRYQIEYPLPGVVRAGTLAWDAVGTAWGVGMAQVEVHVIAPFELVGLQCVQGTAGSRTPCDDVREIAPGHAVATVDRLEAHEGVTITAGTGPALATAPPAPSPPARPDDPGTGLLPPAAVTAAGALVAAGLLLWVVRRAGRERLVVGAGGPADAAFWAAAGPGPQGGDGGREVRIGESELAQMATTEFAPPEGITASQGGIVLTEQVRPEHRVAWLLEAAIEGSIELVDGEGEVTLVRKGPGSPWTASILDRAFAGRNEIQLGTYDSSFASGWQQLGALLRGWQAGSAMWDHRAGRRRVTAVVLGVLGVVLGAAVAVVGGVLANRWGAGWLVVSGAGGLLAGAGLAPAVASWELLVRTPVGSAAWLRVESFRRFLAESEAYHAEEAAKRGVLREYTAWAVAVGEVDRWSSAVRASSIAPTEAGVGYVYMAPLLLSSTMSTATAPSSRGGGGFGGGFGGGGVGGGAGGGGGGSW